MPRHPLCALGLAAALSAVSGHVRSAPPAGFEEITIEGRSSADLRHHLVDVVLRREGIRDRLVLNAMRAVPRHLFVPEDVRDLSYANHPLPIGEGQTISQPYIVAYMTELARVKPESRVLEVGTGSGYQAAVLAEIVAEVYTIEIVEPLGHRAEALLNTLGYDNVHVRIGDGYRGWPEAAPFDAVIVTAAPGHVPQPLVDQLVVGGRLVIPVGQGMQWLDLITKDKHGVQRQRTLPVRFVPMTGEAEDR